MAHGDQEVQTSDRRAARKLVEQAAADGRIIEPDRDRRLEQIEYAHTVDEIAMILHDLRPDPAPGPEPQPAAVLGAQPQPQSESPPEPAPEPPQPTAAAVFGAPTTTPAETWEPPPRRRRRGRGLGSLVAIVVVGIFAVNTFDRFGQSDSLDGLGDLFDGVEIPDAVVDGGPPDVLSPRGLDDLVDELRRENGSTRIFQAVVYPEYAVLDVPVDARSDRRSSVYYDGDLTDNDNLGTSDRTRFDLAKIDARVVLRLIRRASALVDDPTTTYAIIGAPREADPNVWISAYASNDFQESSYIAADRDGTVIRRSAP